MKDRMIIIRKKVLFIITVTHEQEQEHSPETENMQTKPDIDQQQVNLPVIRISAN